MSELCIRCSTSEGFKNVCLQASQNAIGQYMISDQSIENCKYGKEALEEWERLYVVKYDLNLQAHLILERRSYVQS